MTKKTRRTATVAVQFHPMVTEGPLPLDPLNVRIVKRELHRWEHRIINKAGDITALRQLLNSTTVEELWEVPG